MAEGAVSDDILHWIARTMLPHEPAVRRWLATRRLPGIEIDDVVQESYARLIRVKDHRAVRDPAAYFRRTAWSVLVSHVRKERVIALRMVADVNELGAIADEPGPEQLVADRDELHRLAEAIATLPGHVGDVFRLRRVNGLSQKEVAASLGLAESTVEKHLRKALLLLLRRFARGGNRAWDASWGNAKGSEADHGGEEHVSA